jgi:signal peptidase II
MTRKARFPAMLGLAGFVVMLDRYTKLWFLEHFQLGESRRIFSWLYMTLVENTGTAFGLFQDNNRALLIVSYVVLLIFVYGARGLWERGGEWAFWGVALVLGGAAGNIIDRHLYKHVIDFIDLRVWPVFNVADSAITVGAVSTAVGLMLHKEGRSKV